MHLRYAQALVKEENGATVELDVRTGETGTGLDESAALVDIGGQRSPAIFL